METLKTTSYMGICYGCCSSLTDYVFAKNKKEAIKELKKQALKFGAFEKNGKWYCTEKCYLESQ